MAAREKGQNASCVGMCQGALELAEVEVSRGETTHPQNPRRLTYPSRAPEGRGLAATFIHW